MRKCIATIGFLGALALAVLGANFNSHLPYDKPRFDDGATALVETVSSVSQ